MTPVGERNTATPPALVGRPVRGIMAMTVLNNRDCVRSNGWWGRARFVGTVMLALAMQGALSRAETIGPDERPPSPSTAVELQTARRSGVTSIWLAGGIRVHHRRIETVRNQVVVTLAMSGGEQLEGPETRGLSRMAATVMSRWTEIAPNAAARAGSSADIRIVAGAPVDGLQVRMICDPRALRVGMDALREMIESPTITREVLDTSRDTLVAELRREDQDERSLIARALFEAMTPLPADDARRAPPDPRRLASITPEHVSAWIGKHSAEQGSTIEVAVVGDVSLSDALEAVDVALGTLPPRPRAGPGADTRITSTRKAPQPVRVSQSIPGWSSRAAVMSGCVAPEIDRLDDQRVLRAAGRVLADRVRAAASGAGLSIARGDPNFALAPLPLAGMGTFLVNAQVAPADAENAMALLDAELERLLREPPTPMELAAAVAPLIQLAREFETDARYWSGVLARCSALRLDPDEVMSATEFYTALSPDAVRDAMRRYVTPETRIRMTILPPG